MGLCHGKPSDISKDYPEDLSAFDKNGAFSDPNQPHNSKNKSTSFPFPSPSPEPLQELRLNDIVGSAYYVAPEGTEADMWSIGVIVYILLCGNRPFWVRTGSGIFRAVLKADPSFDDSPRPSLSPEATDFVRRLLNKDYRKRMTAAQALSHPWLASHPDVKIPLDMIIYRQVKVYLCSSSLRKSALCASEIVARYGRPKHQHTLHDKYLYWGNRIDCPGKHCDSCEGLGHQESSLRCALEEAMFLKRTFVMPSRMCINPIHNKKGILHQSAKDTSEEGWAASSCGMDSLYDIDLISDTVPVLLDDSKTWYRVLLTAMKLGSRGVAHVSGVSRNALIENDEYSNLLLINRTASPLSWFMECKNRNNRSAIMLPYKFLPSMAAKPLRDAANKVCNCLIA
ncbi:hypothetical protein SAY86_017309 [Trapa natans]|uniref:Protein kinase domain-containing protein n=1 Tax=Trapa natans TaxID=22666 RepID=A0AAN7LPT3_TRANT|nr:hypothetical protein SAY86_017309 [Trapa natans]